MVERPRGPVRDRPRALGLEEHLRARVRDGLVGADRAAELLALLGVVDGHAGDAGGDADRLGRGHHRDRVPRAAEVVAGQLLAVRPSKRTVNSGRVASIARAGSIVGVGGLDREVAAALGGDHERVGDVGVRHRDLDAGQRLHGGRLGVGGAVLVPHRDRPAAFEPGMQQLRRPVRGQRRRRQRVAQLLGHDRELEDPVLGDVRPAELGDLVPVRVGLAVQRDRADLLHRVPRGEELARGALDLALVLGQVEVHPRGSPRTRSATMFLRISVVPPSIEFARARRKRYVQVSSTSWAARTARVHRQRRQVLVDVGPQPLAQRALRPGLAATSSRSSARGRRAAAAPAPRSRAARTAGG